MANPTVFVEPPRRVARRGGIKSVAGEFITLPRLGAAEYIEYISQGCAWPSVAPGLCWGVQPPDAPKTFYGVDTELGIATVFAQYVGVECYLGEGAGEDYATRAKNQLAAGEEGEIEAHLAGWAGGGTAAGTGTLTNAIAMADQWADQKYIGTPVILIGRGNAVRAHAEGSLEGDGKGQIWTINGTPVVSSWVIPVDKVYVIGWPTVYASDVTTTVARNLTQNREMALAERVYAMAVDCQFRGVVTITAPAADPQDPDEDLTILLGSIPSSPIPDGTDATIIAQTNVVPDAEVYLHYSLNGGPDTTAGEMTQTNPHEFVWNVQGDITGPGDSVELWATSGTTESNHITIEVT